MDNCQDSLMKQQWKLGQQNPKFGLGSDSRTEVAMPSEQIPRTGHCGVPFTAHIWELRNPDSEPKMSFWLDMCADTDRHCSECGNLASS